MKYLFAIVLPPLAILMCGKAVQFFLSIILTLCGWLPGIIHALFVVNAYERELQTNRIVAAIKAQK